MLFSVADCLAEVSWWPDMKHIIPLAITGAIVLLIIVLVGEDLSSHLDAFDAWLSSLGPAVQVVYLLVLVIGTTILLPESLFGVSGGVLFGLKWGIPLALAGNLLAASLQYFLARRLLPQIALRIMNSSSRLKRLDSVMRSAGFRLQALVRLTPLNPAALNYALGAYGVRFAPFLAAAVFSLPHIFTEVYLGYAGSHALHRASNGAPEAGYVRDIVIAGGLLASIVTLIVISTLARRAIDRAETTVSNRRGAP